MIIFLTSLLLYPFVGYIVFRGWLRAVPPEHGTSGYQCGDRIITPNSWYIPAIINRETVWYYDGNEYVPRGLPITRAWWICCTLWPLVTTALISNRVIKSGVNMLRNLGQSITAITIAPYLKIPPKTADPDMIKAQAEVETILKESG